MQSPEERAVLFQLLQDTKGLLLELGGYLNQRDPQGRGPPHHVQRALRRKNEMVSRLDGYILGQPSRNEREQQERATQEAQKTTITTLEKQLKDQNTSFEQERARLQVQASVAMKAQTDLSASLGKVVPQLRGFLDAYDREQGQRARGATARTVAMTGPASNQELSRRLSQLTTSFDAERVELLKKMSDTENTHQRLSRKKLSEREAALTCPISLELYENPVVTECCGKTFSSAALSEAMRRNAQCPVCRSYGVATHVNRDMANLVELHRAERSALGLPNNAATSSTTAATTANAGSVQAAGGIPSTAAGRGRGRTASPSPEIQQRNRRSQRVQARASVPHREPARAYTQQNPYTALASRSNVALPSSSIQYGRAPTDESFNYDPYGFPGFYDSDSDY